MARPKSSRPSYRYHVSGQAILTLAGRDFYLGEFNSPESNARYLELLRIYPHQQVVGEAGVVPWYTGFFDRQR